MATQTSLPTLWHVPDDLWSLIAPLLGPEKARGTPGRPAVPFRRVFDGILYVLRTGCQWSALPRAEYAPKSTVWALPAVGRGWGLSASLAAGAGLLRPGSGHR